jgi:hypothetical protein
VLTSVLQKMIVSLVSLLFLTSIIVYTLALLGMQLYGYKLGEVLPPERRTAMLFMRDPVLRTLTGVGRPRLHFDGILQSYWTIFTLFSGEGWSDLLGTIHPRARPGAAAAMDAASVSVDPEESAAMAEATTAGILGAVLFAFVTVFIGNILLWSMFSSVVISSFTRARSDFIREQAVDLIRQLIFLESHAKQQGKDGAMRLYINAQNEEANAATMRRAMSRASSKVLSKQGSKSTVNDALNRALSRGASKYSKLSSKGSKKSDSDDDDDDDESGAEVRTRLNNIEYFPPKFEGLVLGCIDADFCK